MNCGAGEQAVMVSLTLAMRNYRQTTSLMEKKEGKNELAGYHEISEHKAEEEQQEEQPQSPFGADQGFGSLPFPAPFHTINVVMLLFLANIIIYLIMALSPSDDLRDFIVEHFTLSHENYHRIYPFFTSSLYQEQILQLAIDCWLLWQFGQTMLGFLGNRRMAMFWAMTALGGGLIHVARQKFELYYGIDELEVRGRCYGPNPFILGLVGVEGLIFRHLNFIQQPPVPFLVLTAFVMVIDVWRIFTTKPEEHGAPTGGALVAYLFWLLPTRMLGLDKLTAAL
jgi:membrane associated rhomboid family serine protease